MAYYWLYQIKMIIIIKIYSLSHSAGMALKLALLVVASIIIHPYIMWWALNQLLTESVTKRPYKRYRFYCGLQQKHEKISTRMLTFLRDIIMLYFLHILIYAFEVANRCDACYLPVDLLIIRFRRALNDRWVVRE